MAIPLPRPFSVTPRYVLQTTITTQGTFGAISANSWGTVAWTPAGMPNDGIPLIDFPALDTGLIKGECWITPATSTLNVALYNNTGGNITPLVTQKVNIYVI